MKKLNDEIISFFKSQSFVIVTTIDKSGMPHSSCKGIVDIDPDGIVYLLDTYLKSTNDNLKDNPKMNITAVDEHVFQGYCLKGHGKILGKKDITAKLISAWEERISSRITRRLVKNIQENKGHPMHPESLLPKPEYLIAVTITQIVDLSPFPAKAGENNG